ncbi:MAG: tRNA dimethylallyltransferase, partial [Propionivibrio sp.]
AQRIQRALEIFRLSGRPMSELIGEGREQKPPYDFLSLGLLPSDRNVLHARIAHRFDAMLEAGLEDEVSHLRGKYALSLELPSMRCVGYRHVGGAGRHRPAPGNARPWHLRHAPARQAPDHLDGEHAQAGNIRLSGVRFVRPRRATRCQRPGCGAAYPIPMKKAHAVHAWAPGTASPAHLAGVFGSTPSGYYSIIFGISLQ